MHTGRKLLVVVIVITVFLGAILALDPRFIPYSGILRNPFLLIFLFGPTIFFAILAVIKWRKGQIWQLAAFAIGLMCTGLFHQFVAGEADGNPGYTVPATHIAAPAVSLAAYLAAFFGTWAVLRVTKKLRRTILHDDQEENKLGDE